MVDISNLEQTYTKIVRPSEGRVRLGKFIYRLVDGTQINSDPDNLVQPGIKLVKLSGRDVESLRQLRLEALGFSWRLVLDSAEDGWCLVATELSYMGTVRDLVLSLNEITELYLRPRGIYFRTRSLVGLENGELTELSLDCPLDSKSA